MSSIKKKSPGLLTRRCCGVLLHVTSLPSRFGIGDMGNGARRFVGFLSDARQTLWQVLPVNPSHHGSSSPYHIMSAFAGNTLLISPEDMLKDNLVSRNDLKAVPRFPAQRIDYMKVRFYKEALFRKAYIRFSRRSQIDHAYVAFCQNNKDWLEDFALFQALKEYFGGKPWNQWPNSIRDREASALKEWRQRLAEGIGRAKFLQYIFFKQWFSMKRLCNDHGIMIFGDVPVYVDYDSVDVWVHPEIFKLNSKREPAVVSGVPPDYFSATGQLWGNPLYRWDVLKSTGYDWWVRRITQNLRLFDVVRIDHFRGFVAYWQVPANAKTAAHGRWVKAPAADFLRTLMRKFPDKPFIAEDLGYITPDVRKIMHRFKLRGMRVLLFAFGKDLASNPYAPHNHIKDCVVYTGTHDNNTVRGWFEHEAKSSEKRRLVQYLGREVTEEIVHWALVRLAMMSVADTVIIPMQDILGLGESTRMNRPATMQGNWKWRLRSGVPKPSVAKRLARLTELYGRA
jgi:4-alpha-glucanotransferase